MAIDPLLWANQRHITGPTPVSLVPNPVLVITGEWLKANLPDFLGVGSGSCLNGGGDIRICLDEAGTVQCAIDVVTCVTSATVGLQSAEIWVRRPTDYDVSNRGYWISWGRAGQTQPAVGAAFGRNATHLDYEWVYHLEDTSVSCIDSAGNDDLADTGANTTGSVGSGLVTTGASGEGISDTGSHTASSVYSWELTSSVADNTINQYMMELDDGSGDRFALLCWNGIYQYHDGGSFHTGVGAEAVNGALTRLVVTSDGANTQTYINGALVLDEVGNFLNPSEAQTINIGQDRAFTSSFNGVIDEVRLGRNHKSSAQALLESDNELDNLSFWTLTAAVGGTSIVIDSGVSAVNLSTLQSNIVSSVDLLSQIENIILSPSAAQVSAGDSVSAQQESITISAPQAGVVAGQDIGVAQEYISIASNAASVSVGLGIDGGTESISVTPQVSSTSIDGGVSAGTESISVSPTKANISIAQAVESALESIQIATQQAAVSMADILLAGVESITLSPSASTVTLDTNLSGELESIVVTALLAEAGLGTDLAGALEGIELTPQGTVVTLESGVFASLENITLSLSQAVVTSPVTEILSAGMQYTIPLNKIHFTFKRR